MKLLEARSFTDIHYPKLQERAHTVTKKRGFAPKLAAVLVGDDPASKIYVDSKGKRAKELGMESETYLLPGNSSAQELHALIQKLNNDKTVDGILIQKPLPKQIPEESMCEWVHPDKDVDASHPIQMGRLVMGLDGFIPCTPLGIIRLLEFNKISLAGKTACVVGRSNIVGKPMGALLLRENATLIQTHSKTQNLKEMVCQADVVIAAIGKPEFIDTKFLKPGAVVVDVGINRTPGTKKISGDVAFDDAVKTVSAITPVPGGVGPMTIYCLMENTVLAAETRKVS